MEKSLLPPPTFIDTQFVIALINQRDKSHKMAVEMANLYDGEPLITTETVLLEIGNALAREYKTQAVEVIEEFFASEEVEIVTLTPELFAQAFALYRSHEDKEWGMVDCLSFVVMRERGITDALTSDRHFVQAGFRAMIREQNA